jgi:hypothetical protein
MDATMMEEAGMEANPGEAVGDEVLTEEKQDVLGTDVLFFVFVWLKLGHFSINYPFIIP